MKKNQKAEYLRNFIFGVEDSLVSTIGLVSGVAASGVNGKTVFLTGMILVFVESFSMGIGTMLSQNSVEEFEDGKAVSLKRDIGFSLVMFLSYLLSGLLIVLPYTFLPVGKASSSAITIAILSLFILGWYSGKITGQNKLSRGLTMSGFGGTAILLGVIVGKIVGTFS